MSTNRFALCIAALSLMLTGGGTPLLSRAASVEPSKAQITILYDAFGKPSVMEKDWGFAALIEYGGWRILFDTGDNPDILADNAKAKGVDLSKLDFVILSHRHGDHMGGMEYLLSVNPNVRIYAPKENFGVYGFSLPSSFYRKDDSLPPEQRYYDGAPPSIMKFGSAWPRANFTLIEKTTEIAPGIHLIALVSDKPTTMELRELSLAIDTPEGIVVVVGCSHPGIERIVEAAASINPRIHLVAGGFHLVVAKDEEIERVVSSLRNKWAVEYVSPGHCTGEPTFVALKRAFGERYLFAGLGTTITLGATPHRLGGSDQNAAAAQPHEDELGIYRQLARREVEATITGNLAPQGFANIVSGSAKQDGSLSTVRHQPTRAHVFEIRIHGREPVPDGEGRDLLLVRKHEEVTQNQTRLSLPWRNLSASEIASARALVHRE